jgi:hypothetical protein
LIHNLHADRSLRPLVIALSRVTVGGTAVVCIGAELLVLLDIMDQVSAKNTNLSENIAELNKCLGNHEPWPKDRSATPRTRSILASRMDLGSYSRFISSFLVMYFGLRKICVRVNGHHPIL